MSSLKNFLDANGIDIKKCSVEQSKKSFYTDSQTKQPTTTHIVWLQLPSQPVGFDQDYLVLSRTLAESVLKKETKLSDAQVVNDDQGCGLIMPKDVTVLDLTDLW